MLKSSNVCAFGVSLLIVSVNGVIFCGDPGNVTNGRRIGNLFTYPNKVEFECDEGYKLKGVKSRYCQERGKWSGIRLPTCELIHCSEPANPVNGQVSYSSLGFGSELRYECNRGFALKNHVSRVCTADGEWSDKEPDCIVIHCSEPANPVNGRVSYSSLGYGSELRYECNRGFALKNHVSRVCTADGEWSNEDPDCIEVTCEKPLPPEGGSVQFLDGQAVGSIAVYLCGEGTILVGVSLSKCLKNGVWTFEPPKCLRSCIIPVIENGVIGFYKTVRNYRHTYQEFEQFQVGETVEPGESVVLRCQPRFIPVNLTTLPNGDAVNVSCREGVWSKSMQCAPSRCFINSLNYPGLILPTKEYLTSGERFDIKCEEGYEERSSKKTIRCFKGKWELESNPCAISDPKVTCEKPLPPAGGSVQFSDGQAVGSIAAYLCGEGTTLVGVSLSMCLENGVWTFEPPKCLRSCIIPVIENGVIGFYKTVRNYRHTYQEFEQFQVGETIKPGESAVLRCHHGFIPVNLTTLRNGDAENVWCREGVWSKSMQCAPSKCLGVPPSMENGSPVVKKNTNGSTIWYECENGFEKLKKGKVECVYGTWKGDTPVCGGSRCFTNSLNYPGLILPTKEYLTSGASFDIKCKEGYEETSSKKRIRCFKGKWEVESYPCAISDQNVAPTSRPTHPPGACSRDEATCQNGQCIPLEYACDGDYDCTDRSDELNCDSQFQCQPNEFQCDNKKCVLKVWRCDGDNDCSDNSDEKSCNFEIQCPLLEENTNRGIFNIQYENNRKVHSVAKFACQSRTQKLLGTNSRECMPNGQWSGSYPSCEDYYKNCDRFEDSENLEVSYQNDAKVGSNATFSCIFPYKLVGNHQAKCFQNGTWNSALPSCEIPKCSIESLFLPEDVFADLRNVTEDYVPYGTELQLVCNTGTFLSGSSKTKCGQHEIWEHGNVRCKKVCILEEKTSQLLVYPIKDHYSFGEGITFSCPPWQKLSSEIQRVMCLGTSWSNTIPECVRRTRG